ncbi:hypothetical protein HMP0015_0008, partial [Acinetobacter haemolyticus ATCC 19194]
IAYEKNQVIHINTAKSAAGTPGNLAHEFTHTLGYTHFTNFSWLGRSSVPYVTGRFVDKISEQVSETTLR